MWSEASRNPATDTSLRQFSPSSTRTSSKIVKFVFGKQRNSSGRKEAVDSIHVTGIVFSLCWLCRGGYIMGRQPGVLFQPAKCHHLRRRHREFRHFLPPKSSKPPWQHPKLFGASVQPQDYEEVLLLLNEIFFKIRKRVGLHRKRHRGSEKVKYSKSI